MKQMKNKSILWALLILAIALGGYYASVRNGGSVSSASMISPLERSLIGTWQSTDDPKFTREFRKDFTVVDTYAGEAPIVDTGTWSAYKGSEGTYIRTIFDGEQYHFSIVSLERRKLEIIYLEGHGNYSFKRI